MTSQGSRPLSLCQRSVIKSPGNVPAPSSTGEGWLLRSSCGQAGTLAWRGSATLSLSWNISIPIIIQGCTAKIGVLRFVQVFGFTSKYCPLVALASHCMYLLGLPVRKSKQFSSALPPSVMGSPSHWSQRKYDDLNSLKCIYLCIWSFLVNVSHALKKNAYFTTFLDCPMTINRQDVWWCLSGLLEP